MLYSWASAAFLVCATLVANARAGNYLLQLNCSTTDSICDSLVSRIALQLQSSLVNITNTINSTEVPRDVLINDFNECSQNKAVCSVNARCINLFRTYTCQCLPGFVDHNPAEPGTNCTDVNECADVTLNKCSSNGTCTNIAGGYTCQCGNGFVDGNLQNPGTVCQDVDECQKRISRLCLMFSNSVCQNTIGGFECVCKPGFVDNNPSPIVAQCVAVSTAQPTSSFATTDENTTSLVTTPSPSTSAPTTTGSNASTNQAVTTSTLSEASTTKVVTSAVSSSTSITSGGFTQSTAASTIAHSSPSSSAVPTTSNVSTAASVLRSTSETTQESSTTTLATATTTLTSTAPATSAESTSVQSEILSTADMSTFTPTSSVSLTTTSEQTSTDATTMVEVTTSISPTTSPAPSNPATTTSSTQLPSSTISSVTSTTTEISTPDVSSAPEVTYSSNETRNDTQFTTNRNVGLTSSAEQLASTIVNSTYDYATLPINTNELSTLQNTFTNTSYRVMFTSTFINQTTSNNISAASATNSVQSVTSSPVTETSTRLVSATTGSKSIFATDSTSASITLALDERTSLVPSQIPDTISTRTSTTHITMVGLSSLPVESITSNPKTASTAVGTTANEHSMIPKSTPSLTVAAHDPIISSIITKPQIQQSITGTMNSFTTAQVPTSTTGVPTSFRSRAPTNLTQTVPTTATIIPSLANNTLLTSRAPTSYSSGSGNHVTSAEPRTSRTVTNGISNKTEEPMTIRTFSAPTLKTSTEEKSFTSQPTVTSNTHFPSTLFSRTSEATTATSIVTDTSDTIRDSTAGTNTRTTAKNMPTETATAINTSGTTRRSNTETDPKTTVNSFLASSATRNNTNTTVIPITTQTTNGVPNAQPTKSLSTILASDVATTTTGTVMSYASTKTIVLTSSPSTTSAMVSSAPAATTGAVNHNISFTAPTKLNQTTHGQTITLLNNTVPSFDVGSVTGTTADAGTVTTANATQHVSTTFSSSIATVANATNNRQSTEYLDPTTQSVQSSVSSIKTTFGAELVSSKTTELSRSTESHIISTVNPGTSNPDVDTTPGVLSTNPLLSISTTSQPAIPGINVPLTQDNIADVANIFTQQVLTIRPDADMISPEEGTALVQSLITLVNPGENITVDQQVAEAVLAVVDLIGSSTTQFTDATSNNITVLVDDLLNKMVLNNGSFQSNLGSLSVGARDEDGTVRLDLPPFSISGGFNTAATNVAQIKLPTNILSGSAQQERLSFTGYMDARLFRTAGTDSVMSGSFTRSVKSTVINSAVLGSSIAGRTIQNLPNPVEVSLPLTLLSVPTEPQTNSTTVMTSFYNPRCVFFDYQLNAGKGGWSQEGCVTSQLSSGAVTCQCNHLTSFAVIMSVETTVDDHILNIMTYVGCALSILGLTLTIITYTIFKHLRKYKSKRILTHFCLALCGVYISFLAGIAAKSPTNEVQCITSGFFMHFFTAATFAWMMVEVVDMYLMFVKVWSSVRHYVRKASVFGWGFPLVLSIATLGAHFGLVETYPNSEWHRMYPMYRETVVCWLSPLAVYYAFLAPLGLILLVNTFLFVIVLYHVTCKRTGRKLTRVRSNAKRVKGRQHVLNAMAILLLTGPTWLIGFLINVDPIEDGALRRILAYVFVILNAFQGLWIFIVFTVRPRVVRSSWVGLLFKHAGLDQSRSQTHSSGRRGTRNIGSVVTTRTNTRRKSSLDVRRDSTAPFPPVSPESNRSTDTKSPLSTKSSSSSNPSISSGQKSPVQYRYTKDIDVKLLKVTSLETNHISINNHNIAIDTTISTPTNNGSMYSSCESNGHSANSITSDVRTFM